MPLRNEDRELRAAALANATSILLARQRAERELVAAKEALERKTGELAQSIARMRATLESTTDAIAVIDNDGNLTDYNEQLLKLWQIPSNIGRNSAEMRPFFAQQIADPASFLKRLEEIKASSPPETFDVLELKDGRVFERHSRVQLDGGRNRGRVWTFRDITSHRRAAAELREQREWFRVTLASIGDAVITTDLACTVTFLNPVAEAMTGWPGADACGRPLAEVFSIVHEETRETAESPIAQALRDGAVVSLANHTALLSRDGREMAIEDSAAPIRNAEGTITGAVMVFHDVTERRRADEALREREGLLRAMFDQAAVGIARAGMDGRFVEVNRKFCEILGYAEAELQTLSFRDITHPDDLQETQRQVGKMRDGECGSITYEKRYRRKGGSIIWSLTTVTFLRDANGEPHQYIGIVEDITSRKAAEDALRQSERELHALADSIPQLAWMAEPDGTIFWYNRQWFDYTGTTLEEMRGWGWQKVHDPEILPSVLERWQESIRTGNPFDMKFPLRGADGVFRWFLTRVNPVLDSAGRVARWFGTNTDVDQVKRAEDALREESRVLELLNKTGSAIAAQLDLQTLLQTVTDASTELTGARFGAFFYNTINAEGDAFLLYTLSGAPRAAFERFGNPRATAIFGPTFRGEGPIRVADVRKDPRYGRMAPHHGMPAGHLPVCSYLAVPVISRSGEVFGGLFFGHPEPGVFTERAERIVVGVAAQAAVAIDNARLYEAAQKEIAERKVAEHALALRARSREMRAEISAALATDEDWRRVFQRCAQAMVTHMDGVFARIWSFHPTEQVLELQASAGRYTHRDGSHARLKLGEKKIGQIAQLRRAQWTNDLPGDPDLPNPQWAKDEGILAFVGLPLLLHDRLAGVLALWSAREVSDEERNELIIVAQWLAQWIQRRQAEERLRESETRVRVAVETTEIGTWVCDATTRTVELDARCQELFDLPGQGTISLETLVAVAAPADRVQREAALHEVINGGNDRYAQEFRTGAHPPRWLRATGKVFRDDSGRVMRFISAVFDITDQVKALKTTEERRIELEQTVEERTASLKLAIGQMEEFSYSVSHDLRAPLRAIQTYAETLLEDYRAKLDDEGLGYLQRILNASARMDRLTRDVLAYSKVSRTSVAVAAVSLDRLVSETIEQYAPDQRQNGAIRVESPLGSVLAHEPSLVQAVSNLIGNGIKFVAPGRELRLRIWAEPRDGEVRLWVEDNGIGISPDYQHRIWGMFERVHPEDAYEGTGIGLAIVRKAAERMGGSVGLESDGVTGSRFWIQLPAA